ncbi:MAG: hypothetical protein ACI9OO_000122 [Bacteroidia bacterium]
MSVRSMTSFAHQRLEYSWGTCAWEIRSVNQRYLDLSFKLPELWRGLEPVLRDELRKTLGRGKVEVILRIQLQNQSNASLQVNQELVAQLIGAAESIREQLQNPSTIDPLAILQWPGVVGEAQIDTDEIQQALAGQFKCAVDELLAGREREGAELKDLIEQRLEQIKAITLKLRIYMPQLVQAQRDKLHQRLEALQVQLDSDRLEAEIALLAQKIDVAEELDRLDTHVQEVQRILTAGGACGRKLDFLMQELNREANTLSSKAVVADSTQAAVELKVLIEQMREQIQNIE